MKDIRWTGVLGLVSSLVVTFVVMYYGLRRGILHAEGHSAIRYDICKWTGLAASMNTMVRPVARKWELRLIAMLEVNLNGSAAHSCSSFSLIISITNSDNSL